VTHTPLESVSTLAALCLLDNVQLFEISIQSSPDKDTYRLNCWGLPSSTSEGRLIVRWSTKADPTKSLYAPVLHTTDSSPVRFEPAPGWAQRLKVAHPRPRGRGGGGGGESAGFIV
jgi:hypothetical protein